MTYRVALLALTSAAVLAGPWGGFAQARDRLSLVAQAPRLTEPPASTEAAPEDDPLAPDSTDSSATESDNSTTSVPSEEVRTLQEQLGRLGYYQGAMDGIFGTETSEAISLFQRDVGLATTGLPDPLTLQQLQATENPLGIVPETPSAESDSAEFESPELDPVDATAPLDGQPDSTPIEGAAESTEPLTEEATSSPNQTDSAEREGGGGLVRFILVGIMIAAVGISAAVAFLLLFRRPSGSPDPDAAPDAAGTAHEPSFPATPATAPRDQHPISASPQPHSSQPPIAPLPIADAPRNGHTPVRDTPQPAAAQVAAQSSALAPEPTSKLVPVNIIDELVQDLQNPDPAQRRKAIWELGQRGNSVAVQPLVRLMLDADSKERSLILAALAEISTQTLKPMNRALALSLQDENPEVRKNAIRDMTRIYDLMGQAGTMLNHAATDSDPEVRQTASWAMDQLDRMRLKAINTDVSSLPGRNGSDV